MCDEKIAIRVLLRHYWKKDFREKAAAEQICEVEGEGVIHRNTAAIRFKRFDNGDTSLEDKPSRPIQVDNKALVREFYHDKIHTN